MEGAEVAMMEMSAEATWKVMENLLKHGKYNIVTRNAMENAVRLLKDREPVKPQYKDAGIFCGGCDSYVRTCDLFCASCGRKIDWGKRV